VILLEERSIAGRAEEWLNDRQTTPHYARVLTQPEMIANGVVAVKQTPVFCGIRTPFSPQSGQPGGASKSADCLCCRWMAGLMQ
jgi:hypothetical protein